LQSIEDAVLDGSASTTALEVSLATELLRGLAGGGDEAEGANAFNPSQRRDLRGRWTEGGDLGGGFSASDSDIANAWVPSDEEMERHLRDGRAAMERCMDRGEDQLDAVRRPGLGSVDFIWGKAGEPPDFGSGKGVAKIIAKRDYEANTHPKLKGQSGKNIARAMVETLLKGHVGKPYSKNGQPPKNRINVSWENFTATIDRSHERSGSRWLLTGFINLD